MRNSDNKTRRTKEADKAPAPEVPSSASPGRWLTELIENGPDNNPEQYESACLIAESFKLKPRYRRLRYPIHDQTRQADIPASEFIVDDEDSLENRSLCFSYADVAALKAEDTSSNFSMLGQDGVLSGIELFKYQTNRAEEQEDYKPAKKAKRTKGKSESVTKAKYVCIPDEVMDAAHCAWYSDPTEGNVQELWTVLYNFLARETSLARKGDDLRAQGLSDDFLQDEVIRLMALMDKMRSEGKAIKKQPSHYLRSAWKKRRISAFKKLDKDSHRMIPVEIPCSDGEGGPSDDADADAPNHLDKFAFQKWSRGGNGPEETEEQYRARCEAKLSTQSPDVQDVIRMWMQKTKQAQIAEKKGISQSNVCKIIQKAIKTMNLQETGAAK